MDLDTATTEDLLEELAKRWPNLLFMGLRLAENNGDREDHYYRDIGSPTLLLGMVDRLGRYLDDQHEDGEELDPEDL